MKLLFVCDTRPCGHDYGSDFLIQGAYALYGAANVFEFPEKSHLHLGAFENRDACQIDSDAWLPAKGLSAGAVAELVAGGFFDAVILTGAYGTANAWAEVCRELPATTPVIGLHYDDEQTDTRSILEHIAGRPLARYWHRENPPAGAEPLTFSQPRARIRPLEYKPNSRSVFYAGAASDKASPRYRMMESIRESVPDAELRIASNQTDGRLSPELYRERLWESQISVVWTSSATFRAWNCNRFWESLALGCAVVAERAPNGGLHIPGVTWIDSPNDAGPACAEMLMHPDLLKHNQARGQYWFLQHYTSEALVARMVADVGLGGGRGDRE